ncbi:MAG TPA: hypothetical protein VNO30_35515 [Kofleriaceae bacterium]|nr:hypothetical protein [Kofleriaceae bacterium]
MKSWWPVAALAAALAGGCSEDDGIVVGPFTGEVRRFVVDDVRLPRTLAQAMAMGSDLNGDNVSDNQLGIVIAALEGQDDVSPHAADMIRSGVLGSSLELQADDLVDDDTVAVWYFGADGAAAQLTGGRFEGGVFRPNRTAKTSRPGEAVVRLPVFLEADPIEMPLHELEIDLSPDGEGYVATLHGGILFEDAMAAAQQGIPQMITSNPAEHLGFSRGLDPDRDGVVSPAEVAAATQIQALLAPDLQLRGRLLLSFGFQVHLTPCAEGRCLTTPPADRCHDRILDGDETDVDCGGSCAVSCAAARACRAPTDCQSGTCAAGTCTAPSCTDGLRDGLESDVDCGGNCNACAYGARCVADSDCVTQDCTSERCQ